MPDVTRPSRPSRLDTYDRMLALKVTAHRDSRTGERVVRLWAKEPGSGWQYEHLVSTERLADLPTLDDRTALLSAMSYLVDQEIGA